MRKTQPPNAPLSLNLPPLSPGNAGLNAWKKSLALCCTLYLRPWWRRTSGSGSMVTVTDSRVQSRVRLRAERAEESCWNLDVVRAAFPHLAPHACTGTAALPQPVHSQSPRHRRLPSSALDSVSQSSRQQFSLSSPLQPRNIDIDTEFFVALRSRRLG